MSRKGVLDVDLNVASVTLGVPQFSYGYDWVQQGTKEQQRIGQTVFGKRLSVVLNIDPKTPVEVGSPLEYYSQFPIRYLIVIDKQNHLTWDTPGNQPVWTDVMATSSMFALQEEATKHCFAILVDEFIQIPAPRPVYSFTLIDTGTGVVTGDVVWCNEQCTRRYEVPLDYAMLFPEGVAIPDVLFGNNIFMWLFPQQDLALHIESQLEFFENY